MELFDMVFDGAVKVAVSHLVGRNGKESVNVDVLSWAGKKVLHGAIDGLLEDWGEAVDAVVPEVGLRALVNAQANSLAGEIVNAYYEELAWHCYEGE